jgi:hypothetical protein
MLYRIVQEQGSPSPRYQIIENDEIERLVAVCDSELDAETIVSALNLRLISLNRLAHDFIASVDDPDSSRKLWDNWQGIVKSNKLGKSEAEDLWELIFSILQSEKRP